MLTRSVDFRPIWRSCNSSVRWRRRIERIYLWNGRVCCLNEDWKDRRRRWRRGLVLVSCRNGQWNRRRRQILVYSRNCRWKKRRRHILVNCRNSRRGRSMWCPDSCSNICWYRLSVTDATVLQMTAKAVSRFDLGVSGDYIEVYLLLYYTALEDISLYSWLSEQPTQSR
jgi:hypothetical protein